MLSPYLARLVLKYYYPNYFVSPINASKNPVQALLDRHRLVLRTKHFAKGFEMIETIEQKVPKFPNRFSIKCYICQNIAENKVFSESVRRFGNEITHYEWYFCDQEKCHEMALLAYMYYQSQNGIIFEEDFRPWNPLSDIIGFVPLRYRILFYNDWWEDRFDENQVRFLCGGHPVDLLNLIRFSKEVRCDMVAHPEKLNLRPTAFMPDKDKKIILSYLELCRDDLRKFAF